MLRHIAVVPAAASNFWRSIIDTAVHVTIEIVEYFRAAIFLKALTCVTVAKEELFDF
jgi:hypothetical protein